MSNGDSKENIKRLITTNLEDKLVLEKVLIAKILNLVNIDNNDLLLERLNIIKDLSHALNHLSCSLHEKTDPVNP